jgi:hypothetical protein
LHSGHRQDFDTLAAPIFELKYQRKVPNFFSSAGIQLNKLKIWYLREKIQIFIARADSNMNLKMICTGKYILRQLSQSRDLSHPPSHALVISVCTTN